MRFLRRSRRGRPTLNPPLIIHLCVKMGCLRVDTEHSSVTIESQRGKKCHFRQIFRTPGAFEKTIVLLLITSEGFSNNLRVILKRPQVVF